MDASTLPAVDGEGLGFSSVGIAHAAQSSGSTQAERAVNGRWVYHLELLQFTCVKNQCHLLDVTCKNNFIKGE